MSDFMWFDEVNPVEKAQKTARAVEAVRTELEDRGIIAFVMKADSLPEAEQRLAMREVNATIDEVVTRHMPEDEGAKARLVSSIFKQFEAAKQVEAEEKMPMKDGRPAFVSEEEAEEAEEDEESDSDDDDEDDDDDDDKKKKKKKKKRDEDEDDDDDEDSEESDDDSSKKESARLFVEATFDPSNCAVCGESPDVCGGFYHHGPRLDPIGAKIANLHYEDNHEFCHPNGCSDASTKDVAEWIKKVDQLEYSEEPREELPFDSTLDQVRTLQQNGDHRAYERIIDPEGYHGEGF